MAIFTLLASFILTGTFVATGLGVSALALGLGLATTIGISYAMKALAGDPQTPARQDSGGVQGTLQSGGDVPRSFNLGYSVTAGSLVYARAWGNAGNTPNAFFTQVISLSDLPGCTLQGIWVNGEKCTIAGTDGGMGKPVTEYNKTYPIGPIDHLWVRYYDGTQTTADAFLVGSVSSAARPYQSTRVGTGICYAIVTAMVDDTLFTGFPTFRFELSGIPLYDISKDSTAGGSGSHLYSNPATWGGDGDNLPAVQAYNLLRGIRYAGAWLYGLQNIGAARLPAANWIAQVAKCRATITGLSGPEPSYRAGGQINVDAQPANAIEALLTACQGRLSEIGGFYKIHLGAPDSSAFNWTDADLLSSEQQIFRPFFSLADSVNGIQGTYPDPGQAWQTATAPALYRTDLEARDGNRRLMAAPAFDFVPYPEQVQRLQKSALEESQRARTHILPFPPAYWIIEPGDIGTWDSVRNGYVAKLFRVDTVTDRANLDIFAAVTEIDPSDYDWTHATDYTGVASGPTAFPRPPAQGIVDWFAQPWTLYDSGGNPRRAAIKLSWDGTLPGVSGVLFEVRLASTLEVVHRGNTDQVSAGAIIISQNLIGNTNYEARGQYIPSSPRDMLWSSWLAVTTPNVDEGAIDAQIRAEVALISNYLNDEVAYGMQLIASTASNSQANAWLDNQEIRTELSAAAGTANASVTSLTQARVSDQVAFASYQQTVSATFDDTNASVTTNASAIATLNGYAAAQYSVTLDVNGYATGFNLFNGGAGVSTATFVQDKFQIAAPGVSGGAPVPIFTVANVAGAPKVALRGDMFVDGSVNAVALVAQSITSASGRIGDLSVNSISVADNAITVPAVQTLGTTINAPQTNTIVSTVTLPINTAGLAGKSIAILASWVGVFGYGGTGANPSVTLIIDGNLVQTVTVTNSQDGFIALSGSASFIASGGVDSKVVSVSLLMNTTGTPSLIQRTISAVAAKR